MISLLGRQYSGRHWSAIHILEKKIFRKTKYSCVLNAHLKFPIFSFYVYLQGQLLQCAYPYLTDAVGAAETEDTAPEKLLTESNTRRAAL